MSTPMSPSALIGGGHRFRMLPAGRASRYRSMRATSWPAWCSDSAAAMPAGPAPMTATRPGRVAVAHRASILRPGSASKNRMSGAPATSDGHGGEELLGVPVVHVGVQRGLVAPELDAEDHVRAVTSA